MCYTQKLIYVHLKKFFCSFNKSVLLKSQRILLNQSNFLVKSGKYLIFIESNKTIWLDQQNFTNQRIFLSQRYNFFLLTKYFVGWSKHFVVCVITKHYGWKDKNFVQTSTFFAS